MITIQQTQISPESRGFIIPLVKGAEVLGEALPQDWKEAVLQAIKELEFQGEEGEVQSFRMCLGGKISMVVLAGLGLGENLRACYLCLAKAFSLCQQARLATVSVLLDESKQITWQPDLVRKICLLPFQTAYQFTTYKTTPVKAGMEQVEFITQMEDFPQYLLEGQICGESTVLARDLINHPAMFMTPAQFCLEAKRIGRECGIDVKVYKQDQIRAMGMESFLAVARGAEHKPRLLVMRYTGTDPETPPVALVGKGLMYDSGGYDIKSKMLSMHSDMGGAAAVVAAIRAAALMQLKVNVVAVVAACKNMISGDAYVAGDVLSSMNGKTIEMVNSDAEGRLTLADAITYAIRKEQAAAIVDIATLTGAAKGAVGSKTAPVLCNDETLFSKFWKASLVSCEKIWRLNADQELRPSLDSAVADLKNTDPGSPMGGGAIVAGLFIQEFVEDKPWIHIDMAPVNWQDQSTDLSPKGGTGYGVSLLFEALKLME